MYSKVHLCIYILNFQWTYPVDFGTTNGVLWLVGWWRQGAWLSFGTRLLFHTWAVRRSGSTADSAGAVRASPWLFDRPIPSWVPSWWYVCSARWRCICWTDTHWVREGPHTNMGFWNLVENLFFPLKKWIQ